jgi:hypothetical protein
MLGTLISNILCYILMVFQVNNVPNIKIWQPVLKLLLLPLTEIQAAVSGLIKQHTAHAICNF